MYLHACMYIYYPDLSYLGAYFKWAVSIDHSEGGVGAKWGGLGCRCADIHTSALRGDKRWAWALVRWAAGPCVFWTNNGLSPGACGVS